MTLIDLAKLGRQMRTAQRKYFRTQSNNALAESKVLEQRFDRAVEDVLRQPELFDESEKPT